MVSTPLSSVPSAATGTAGPPSEAVSTGGRSVTWIVRPCGKSESVSIATTVGKRETAAASSSSSTFSVVIFSAVPESAAVTGRCLRPLDPVDRHLLDGDEGRVAKPEPVGGGESERDGPHNEGDRDGTRAQIAGRSRGRLGTSLLRARELRFSPWPASSASPSASAVPSWRLASSWAEVCGRSPVRFLGDAFVPPALGARRRLEGVEERDEAIRPQFAGERASPARADV